MGATPLRISPLWNGILGFDAAATRVLVSGPNNHVHGLRIDGTEDRDLGALSPYHLEVY